MSATTKDWRTPISFDTPRVELQQRLGYLYKREGRLFNMGTTCPVKDNDETSCLACPFSQAEDPKDLRGHLCRVGIDQERVQTVLIAQVEADRKSASGG